MQAGGTSTLGYDWVAMIGFTFLPETTESKKERKEGRKKYTQLCVAAW